MKLAVPIGLWMSLAPALAKPQVETVGKPAGLLRHGRAELALAPLADGRVAAIGGFAPDELATPRVIEVFDPKARSWQTAQPMVWGRRGHTATTLVDGRVLVVGGHELDTQLGFGSWPQAPAEIWDPRKDTWIGASSMAEPRSQHTATLLAGGGVLIAGGRLETNTAAEEAELYDPATDRFRRVGRVVHPREKHAAVALAGGRVALVGGSSFRASGVAADITVGSIEVWDPVAQSWRDRATLVHPRMHHTATALPDGRLLVVGGANEHGFVAEAEVCDLDAGKCTAAGRLAFARALHTATLLRDGRVLVAGGDGGTQKKVVTTATVEIWDPQRRVFRMRGVLAQARSSHAAIDLADGSILIAGGELGLKGRSAAEIIRSP